MINKKRTTPKRIIATSIGVVGVPVLLGWVLFDLILDAGWTSWSGFLNQIWYGWLFPNGWNLFGATPFFWFLVISVIASIAGYISYKKKATKEKSNWYKESHAEKTFWVVVSVLALIAVPLFGITTFQWGLWNAEYYNRDSVYVVPDMNDLPNTLTRVAENKNPQVEITEGEMPDSWVPRVASATGATYVMKKTGDTIQNTQLLADTISYIYGDTEEDGHWTAIRNGINRQPIYGVVSWSGAGERVETCKFDGANKINKTFGAPLGMSLNNEIAKFKPTLVYQKSAESPRL